VLLRLDHSGVVPGGCIDLVWEVGVGWGGPVPLATAAGVQGNLPAMNCDPTYDVATPFARALINHLLARLLAALVDDALGVLR